MSRDPVLAWVRAVTAESMERSGDTVDDKIRAAVARGMKAAENGTLLDCDDVAVAFAFIALSMPLVDGAPALYDQQTPAHRRAAALLLLEIERRVSRTQPHRGRRRRR